MRKAYIIFICVMLTVMILPFVLTTFMPSSIGAENRMPAAWPELVNEEGVNFSFPDQYEAWLDDHIALRGTFISLYADFLKRIGTSAEEQVILGEGDWLFFRETLNDYTGHDALSDGEIARIALMLDTVDATLRARGSRLIIAIAPNKASVYPEYMSGSYPKRQDASNAERLVDAVNVTCVPLTDILRAHADEGLYFHTDTHWNALGARYAANAILSVISDETGISIMLPNVESDYYVIADWSGDLSKMLNPYSDEREIQQHYNDRSGFQYEGRVRSTEALTISTNGGQAPLNLLVLRDSFCNLLLEDISSAVGSVKYMRAMPLPLTDSTGTDAVLLEMVERRLGELLDKPPVITAEQADAPGHAENATICETYLDVQKESNGIRISGYMDGEPENLEAVKICVRSSDDERWYAAMPISGIEGHNAEGFSALFDELPENVSICAYMCGDGIQLISGWTQVE